MYKFIFSIFLFFVIISICQAQVRMDSLVGIDAYNFEVKTTKGKKYKLSDLKDKIVVLNFWYLGCRPCVHEFPDLNNVVEKYKNNKNVIFLGISVDGKEEVIKIFLKRKIFNYQIVVTDYKIAKKQGVYLYPTNIVIDKKGKITFALAGRVMDIEKLLTEEIEKNLKE